MKRALFLSLLLVLCVTAAKYFEEEYTLETLPISIEAIKETPAATSPSFSPKHPQATTKDFEAMTENVLNELPSPRDLRKHKEISVHFTPLMVTAVAPKISRIQDEMRERPELIPLGLRFYEACVSHPDTFVAIRALCLHLHRSWVKEDRLSASKEVALAAEALRGIEP